MSYKGVIFGHQSAFVAQVSFLRKKSALKYKKEEESEVFVTYDIKPKIKCVALYFLFCFLYESFYFLLPPGIKKGKAFRGILNEAQFFV